MPRNSDPVARLAAVCETTDEVCGDEVQRVLLPDPERSAVPGAEAGRAVRDGRAALGPLLEGCLVADRLAALLAAAGTEREQIEAALNAPFEPGREITVEFLNRILARIQSLEAGFRLLAEVVLELADPRDRSPARHVSRSSAVRRRS